MKFIAILFISILLISCTPNASKQKENLLKSDSICATELIKNGFLKYADSAKMDSLEIQLKSSFDIHNEDYFRIAHIDAEALGEYNFDFFVPSLNSLLGKRKINLTVKKLNSDDNSNDIIINQDTIKLYTQDELDKGLFWETASRNFFKKVNSILQTKNSEEQFYLLYGGNDLHVLLLTEKQFSIISEYYKDNEKEKPYIP